MFYYAQFSQDAPSGERQKLWNPSKTLGIINTDPGYQCITCTGHAPSQGRRCRNPINKENKDAIISTLNEIAYLQPDDSSVEKALKKMAWRTLCVRFHRNQAEMVAMQWQRKIEQLKTRTGGQTRTKPMQNVKKQESTSDQNMADLQAQMLQMKESLAQLQEELDRQRQYNRVNELREEQQAKDRREEDRKFRQSEEKEAKRKERERLEKEQLKKEKLEKERLEKERLEKEKLEQERLEKERQERERKEEERREKERKEKERREKEEEKKRRDRAEQDAKNEEIRQRAQRRREENERKQREKEQKEREEWDQAWTKYQDQWVKFRASPSREGDMRDAIPWPVKSGSYRDVNASNVNMFFKKAVPKDANISKVMRKECLKWHLDKVHGWLRGGQLTDVDRMMIKMICFAVTDVLNDSSRRSAEFFG